MRSLSLLVTLVIMLLQAGHAADTQHNGLRLDFQAFAPIQLPNAGEAADVLLALEYSEQDAPSGYPADLNRDGFKDYLVQSAAGLCGTGGCVYALVDGKTMKKIGDFFGSPIVILDQNINGFPIVQSYGHLSVNSGDFTIYVFDGASYVVVSTVHVEGASLEELFKQLWGFRAIKPLK